MNTSRRRQLANNPTPDVIDDYTILGNIRRGRAIEVEHPDCFRIDWYQGIEGEAKFGYYLYYSTDYAILDGTLTSITAGNNGEVVFSNVPIGNHIAYIHTFRAIPSNHALQISRGVQYVRLPYNAEIHQGTITSGNMANKWKIIDILSPNYLRQVKTNAASVFSNADIIRVPLGTKSIYLNADVGVKIGGKMQEVNFKYTLE